MAASASASDAGFRARLGPGPAAPAHPANRLHYALGVNIALLGLLLLAARQIIAPPPELNVEMMFQSGGAPSATPQAAAQAAPAPDMPPLPPSFDPVPEPPTFSEPPPRPASPATASQPPAPQPPLAPVRTPVAAPAAVAPPAPAPVAPPIQQLATDDFGDRHGVSRITPAYTAPAAPPVKTPPRKKSATPPPPHHSAATTAQAPTAVRAPQNAPTTVQTAPSAAPSTAAQAHGGDSNLPRWGAVKPDPTYPESLRRRGIEGHVVMHIATDAMGHPLSVTVTTSSGYPQFDAAALQTVRSSWRLPPHVVNGQLAGGAYDEVVNFVLQ